ncbi:MAG: TrmB family transcriptional regulator [Candidatus Bathyarchaeia archaeon]
MLIHEEDAQTLRMLGFTHSQAKVYLILAALHQADGKTIWKHSGVARQDIYRVLNELQEKGLVEKAIGARPTEYRPVKIEDALSILLLEKAKEYKETEEKSRELLRKFVNTQIVSPEEENPFVLVPGKAIIIKKLRESLQKAQFSVDTITIQQRFSQAVLEFADDYRDALKRGVKIRIATEKHLPETKALKTVRTLKMNPRFELRNVPDSPEAIVSIFDGKEAFFSMSATAHLDRSSGLWSKNTGFVALARTYFEMKWREGLEENLPRE